MNAKDQFRFVRQNIKKNKTRLFMTVLATAIGCAFLIVLASVGFGLHKSLVQDMMEDRLVTEIEVYAKEKEQGDSEQINDRHIDYFEAIEHVEAVTRRQELYQSPHFYIDDFNAYADPVVTHFPSEIKAGLKLSEGRLPEKENEVVVGYSFQEELVREGNEDKAHTYEGVLIGQTMEMEVIKFEDGEEKTTSIPLTIVGITEKPTKEWIPMTNVFISQDILNEVEAFTGTPGGSPEPIEIDENEQHDSIMTYDEVKIYADNVQSVSGIIDQLDADNYITYSIVNEMKQINMVFTIMKIGLIFIGTIALIIASIGIYNTMTMAVTERAPDIGIMKAIGANPKTIKRIFLLESSYIGLLGAFIGTIVAYGISAAVNFALPYVLTFVFEETPPEELVLSYIPWSLTLISIAICLLVTIFSGWRPAQRATKVDVLQAMRREI